MTWSRGLRKSYWGNGVVLEEPLFGFTPPGAGAPEPGVSRRRPGLAEFGGGGASCRPIARILDLVLIAVPRGVRLGDDANDAISLAPLAGFWLSHAFWSVPGYPRLRPSSRRRRGRPRLRRLRRGVVISTPSGTASAGFRVSAASGPRLCADLHHGRSFWGGFGPPGGGSFAPPGGGGGFSGPAPSPLKPRRSA